MRTKHRATGLIRIQENTHVFYMVLMMTLADYIEMRESL